MIIILQRYLHLKEIIVTYNKNENYKRLNKAGLFFGLLSCLGVSIVGNFQINLVRNVHLAGAFMAFGGLLVYCWIQTIISRILSDILYSDRCFFVFRIFLCTFGCINFILST